MIALISDIHSNLEALSAVMADIKQADCEKIYCLGDIVGYGPNPIECVDIVMEQSVICTMGNHDFALLKMPFGFNKLARQAIEWQKKILKPSVVSMKKRKRWKWIEGLPYTYGEGSILYLHASPLDPIMDYVKESDVEDLGLGVGNKIKDIFSRINFLCFVGHTHKPCLITDDYKYITPDQLPDGTIQLDRNRKYLVNIGSVGQPRDRIPDSCYVLFDGKDTLTYRRVPYDVDATVQKIYDENGLDNRLGDRLREGR